MTNGNRFDGLLEFAETVRTGTFTAAAEVLGVTASAVGKSVTRLEARLGTKLLHRTTRSLSLTNEGEVYLATCLSVLDELDGAEGAFAVGRSVPVGRIRVDLPGAFGRRHVLPILLDLSERHARLDLSVNFSERTIDMVAESSDLAVRIGDLNDDSALTARRLGTQRLVVCAAPNYLAEKGVPGTPQDLQQKDCVFGWRRGQQGSWIFKSREGVTFSQDIRLRHEFSDGEAMVDAILAGCGVSQLPTWLVHEHLQRGTLVEILKDYAGAEMPIHAIWPQSRFMKPKLRVLIDALVDAAALPRSGFRP